MCEHRGAEGEGRVGAAVEGEVGLHPQNRSVVFDREAEVDELFACVPADHEMLIAVFDPFDALVEIAGRRVHRHFLAAHRALGAERPTNIARVDFRPPAFALGEERKH